MIFKKEKRKGKNGLDFLWSNLKWNKKMFSLLHWPLSKMLIRSVFVHVWSFTGYILPIRKKCHFSTHFNCNIVQVSIHWMLEPSYENHYSSNKFLLWNKVLSFLLCLVLYCWLSSQYIGYYWRNLWMDIKVSKSKQWNTDKGKYLIIWSYGDIYEWSNIKNAHLITKKTCFLFPHVRDQTYNDL